MHMYPESQPTQKQPTQHQVTLTLVVGHCHVGRRAGDLDQPLLLTLFTNTIPAVITTKKNDRQ
jgi:hypothetical protein